MAATSSARRVGLSHLTRLILCSNSLLVEYHFLEWPSARIRWDTKHRSIAFTSPRMWCNLNMARTLPRFYYPKEMLHNPSYRCSLWWKPLSPLSQYRAFAESGRGFITNDSCRHAIKITFLICTAHDVGVKSPPLIIRSSAFFGFDYNTAQLRSPVAFLRGI